MKQHRWSGWDTISVLVLFCGSVLFLWLLVWPMPPSGPLVTKSVQPLHSAVLSTPATTAIRQFLPAVGAVSPLRLTTMPARSVVPDAELVWRGQCTPGAQIAFREAGSHPLAETICSAAGDFTLSFRVTLPAGDHHMILSEGSNPLHQLEGMLLVDPSLSPPAVRRQSDGKSWWLAGTTFPGTLVRVYSGPKLLGAVIAGADGSWRWQPTDPVALAGQPLKVVGVGLLGSEGTPSPPLQPIP